MDPILFAVVSRFGYRRIWHSRGQTFAAAQRLDGRRGLTAIGRDATDALLELLARWAAQSGGVDA